MPGRDEIVARIRKLNGQEDPNAEETPEMAAKKQAKDQADQQAQAMQQQRAQLEIDELQAKIDKLRAEAVSKNVEGLYSGMTAANLAATVPGILPIADGLLLSSGFKDANGAPLAPQPQESMPVAAIPGNTNPVTPPNPDLGLNAGIETGDTPFNKMS